LTVTLYSKPGCHLCEELRAALDELRDAYALTIEEIDITQHAELFARYRFEIPVLFEGGREIARGRISDRELIERLTSR
jgi:glutaredoxin